MIERDVACAKAAPAVSDGDITSSLVAKLLVDACIAIVVQAVAALSASQRLRLLGRQRHGGATTSDTQRHEYA
jgi:hypothetical protein